MVAVAATFAAAVAPFQTLGPAPDQLRLCGALRRGGAEVQIMHRSHVDWWHRRCAEEYFGAPVPVPDPPAAPAPPTSAPF
jgi:hypothetical protein